MTSEGSGRYDHLHGDEDELAAERAETKRLHEYAADHWDEMWTEDEDDKRSDG